MVIVCAGGHGREKRSRSSTEAVFESLIDMLSINLGMYITIVRSMLRDDQLPKCVL